MTGKRLFTFFIFALGIGSICMAASIQESKKGKLELVNTLDIQRKDVLISVSRTQIEKTIGKLSKNEFVQIRDSNGHLLTIQFDDLNQDGIWDEAAFLCDLSANQKKSLSIEKMTGRSSLNEKQRAHVRMKLKGADNHFGPSVTKLSMPFQNPPTDFSKTELPPYLTEGPGWENDKVAFRYYFDTRNNKDIYGKRIPAMVMDSVGENPANSYHKLATWGMDILRVGTSLGAGALAFSYKNKGVDTLVRLGGSNIRSESYEQIADGPIRAIFKMKYTWLLDGRVVDVTELISIWGGQYFYQSEVFINGIWPKDTKVDMGIANFYENKMDTMRVGNANLIYSYGKQSENKDNLGLAVLGAGNRFTGYRILGDLKSTLTDITDTYTLEQNIKNKLPAIFRFYSGWQLSDDRFKTENGFAAYLKEAALEFSHPIIIYWN